MREIIFNCKVCGYEYHCGYDVIDESPVCGVLKGDTAPLIIKGLFYVDQDDDFSLNEIPLEVCPKCNSIKLGQGFETILKPIVLPPLSDNTIKKIILDYLGRQVIKPIYPSDIACAFNLDAEKVYTLCEELIKEGKITNGLEFDINFDKLKEE